MRNKNSFLKVAVALAIAAQMVSAAEDITDKFTDLNFRAKVYEAINKTAPAPIYDSDVDTVESLDVSERYYSVGNITSLAGIEYFTALTRLECSYNQLTTLDVSKNTLLTSLSCYRNNLTTLDVSGCTALTSLDCRDNQLTTLDVSGFTALTSLECSSNQLTTLDVSGCTALTSLSCSSNQLTTLDVSGFTALTSLECSSNQLTTLDVSGCTALTSLYCFNNQLTTLDVSGFTALTTLYCSSNQLTNLDVSGCTAMTSLYCSGNQLTNLDVSGCTALTSLNCSGNKLTTLDVSGCTALTSLNCSGNKLTTLDVSKNTELVGLDCSNNQLTTLDVSKNTLLTSLSCYRNNLTTLDVSKNTALTSLLCSENNLTTLDVSKNIELTELDVRYNYFTNENKIIGLSLSITTYFQFDDQYVLLQIIIPDLNFRAAVYAQIGKSAPAPIYNTDVNNITHLKLWDIESLVGIEYFTALTTLDCGSNQLTTLDVSKNTLLTWLDCSGNQLITLDVSKNTLLTSLSCYRNNLTTLDVSKNTALTSLLCSENNLVTLDVSKNTLLTTLECGSNQLTTLDVSKNTLLTSLYCYRNNLTTLDVSKNTALTSLLCSENNLVTLDVSKNTLLTWLDCSGNQLITLDVSKNTLLTSLDCGNSQLTTLDLSKNTALTTLSCYYNRLTTLDVSGCTALTNLSCSNNQLTTLDVSKNTVLTYLDCSNNQLTTLDVSKNTVLTHLYCSNNQLTTLDVSKNTVLTYLDCRMNQLTTLDVSNKSDFDYYEFYPQRNPIDTDITDKFTDPNFKAAVYEYIGKSAPEPIYDYDVCLIVWFIVPDKNITSLAGIEYFTNLGCLDVSNNRLTSLDISKNTGIFELDVSYNYLTDKDRIVGWNEFNSEFIFEPQNILRAIVKFNSNGGSSIPDIVLGPTDIRINKPSDPTKNNSPFGGWYKDAALTTPWNFETDVVTANITLYAKWIEVVNVAWSNSTFEWNGEPQAPTATAVLLDGTPIILTVSGQRTNLGENYIATAILETPNDNIQLANTSKTFSITERTVAVKWENTGPFIYNRTVQAPTAKLETGFARLDTAKLLVGGGQSQVGVYTEQRVASAQIEDQAIAKNVILTNRSISFEIIPKPLTARLKGTVNNKLSLSYRYETEAELEEHLSGMVEYVGFASDSTGTDSENDLRENKPKVKLHESESGNSQRSLRGTTASVSEVIRQYEVEIKTDEVKADNYTARGQEGTTLSVSSLLLSGTASVSNATPKVSDIILAYLEGDNTESAGGLTYKWYVDGELSGSSISYTIKASDVGKDIRAEISGTNTVGKAISEIVRAAGGANPIIDIKNPDKRGGIRLSSNIVSEKAVITIDLPNNERVSQMKAVVYDNTGNVVFETEARGGKAEWDLTNNAGRNAANGTYLIIVEARGNNAKTYKYSAKLGVKR